MPRTALAGQPRRPAISSPSPTGRIVAVKRGSPRTTASKARSAVVSASVIAGVRHAAAPQDVVGDDEGARREARDEGIEVRLVLGLQGVDEGEVERAGQGGVGGGERLERLGGDDRDPLVGDPGLAPPAAGEIGPRRDPDRSSRSSRRPAGRAPARGSSSRTPCRPRRSGGGPRRAPRGPGRCRGRRSGSGRARRPPRSPRGPAGSASSDPRSSASRERPGVQSRSFFIGLPSGRIGRQTSSPAPKYSPAARIVPARSCRR